MELQPQRRLSDADGTWKSPATCSASRARRIRTTATRRSAAKARSAFWSTPELDTIRFDTLWNLDLRWAWNARLGGERAHLQFIADLFNVFNSNTEITRERNSLATTFGVLGSNLSPRIVRFGVRVGF